MDLGFPTRGGMGTGQWRIQGGRPQWVPPYDPKFSHAVFGKIWQKSYVGVPPRGSAPPPTGNPGSAPAGDNHKGEGRRPITYLASCYWKLHENKEIWFNGCRSYALPKSDNVQWFVFTFMQFSGEMAKMIGWPPPHPISNMGSSYG